MVYAPLFWIGELFLFNSKFSVPRFIAPLGCIVFGYLCFLFTIDIDQFFFFFSGFSVLLFMVVFMPLLFFVDSPRTDKDFKQAASIYSLFLRQRTKEYYLKYYIKQHFSEDLILSYDFSTKDKKAFRGKKELHFSSDVKLLLSFEEALNDVGVSLNKGNLKNLSKKEKLLKLRKKKEQIIKEEEALLKSIYQDGDKSFFESNKEELINTLQKHKINNS